MRVFLKNVYHCAILYHKQQGQNYDFFFHEKNSREQLGGLIRNFLGYRTIKIIHLFLDFHQINWIFYKQGQVLHFML